MLTLFDIKYAARALVKSPNFLIMSTLLMTCGLGLFIFMQSFIYNTLEGPLPFAGGDRVRVLSTVMSNGDEQRLSKMADYKDIQAMQTSFEKMATYAGRRDMVRYGNNSFNEWVYYSTPEVFDIVDVKPIQGRIIEAEDSQPGAERVMVISEIVWREWFANDPDILGQKVEFRDVSYTIVGITPEGFRFPQAGRVWASYPPLPNYTTRNESESRVIFGVLKPGVSDAMAEKDLKWIMSELDAKHPDQQNGRSMKLETYQQGVSMFDPATSDAIKLAVILVLLLACINTGSLLLSRLMSRAQVTAVNRALGATRGRMFAQMMIDSFLITFLSCVLALMVASALMNVTFDNLIVNHGMVPYWWRLGLTSHSIVQAIIVSIVAVIVIGAIPAWKVANMDPNSFLRAGTRGSQSKKSALINKAIIVVEIAIASAILIVTASILNRVNDAKNIDYGAATDKHLSAWTVLPSRFDTEESRLNFYKSLQSQLEKEPTIEQVSFGVTSPLANSYVSDIQIDGVNYGADPDYPAVDLNIVSHEYFENFDIELKQGRLFSLSDKADSPPAAIVTEKFVKEHYPNGDPIGKKFRVNVESQDWLRISDRDDRWVTIVGVVNDVVNGAPVQANLDRASIFLSHEQSIQSITMIALKANGVQPESLKETYRSIINNAYPDVMTINIASIEEKRKRENRDRVFVAQQFMVFGVVSIILAFTGIYGVMANTMIQRKQEVGVRRALGANKTDIYQFFLGATSVLIVLGLVIGVSSGVVITNKLTESQMAIFATLDAVTVSIFVAAMIIIATIIPLLRLLKFQPVFALREE